MNATFNLPADVFHEIQLRAERQGRKPEEVVTDLLRAGIAVDAPAGQAATVVVAKNLPTMTVRAVPSADAGLMSAQEVCNLMKSAELDLDRMQQLPAPRTTARSASGP